jgi:hypothetical protein
MLDDEKFSLQILAASSDYVATRDQREGLSVGCNIGRFGRS